MPHVLSFVHALNISWIKRVLDPDNYAPWKVLLTDVLEDLGQDKFWYYSQSALKLLSAKCNPFWKKMLLICVHLLRMTLPQPPMKFCHSQFGTMGE